MNNTAVSIVQEIMRHAGRFALAFIVVFILTFAFLAAIGAVPTLPKTAADTMVRGEDILAGETPVRIVAETIDLDEQIQAPNSRDLSVLDEALLKGVVFYPGSGLLGENGNTLLFGHSSYLSLVHNSAYRAFNDIQKLKVDDSVSVYSEGREYRYRVTSVRFAKAEEEVIDLRAGKSRLTLVTCDSFRTKSDRFVIEAELVGTYLSA